MIMIIKIYHHHVYLIFKCFFLPYKILDYCPYEVIVHFSNFFSKDLHNQYFSGNDLTLHYVILIYLNFILLLGNIMSR